MALTLRCACARAAAAGPDPLMTHLPAVAIRSSPPAMGASRAVDDRGDAAVPEMARDIVPALDARKPTCASWRSTRWPWRRGGTCAPTLRGCVRSTPSWRTTRRCCVRAELCFGPIARLVRISDGETRLICASTFVHAPRGDFGNELTIRFPHTFDPGAWRRCRLCWRPVAATRTRTARKMPAVGGAGGAARGGGRAPRGRRRGQRCRRTAGCGVGLTAKQARGEYLVDAVNACGDCHTPQTPTGPDLTHYLAGNPTFIQLPTGDALPTRNLTNDPTGLMNRTDDEIKNMFQNGVRPTATGSEALNPVMPYYVFHNMDADDADAIVAYLRTVPGVNNTIPRLAAAVRRSRAGAAAGRDQAAGPPASYPNLGSAMRGQYLAARGGICVECHTKHLDPGSATVLDEAHLFAGGEDFSALFASTLMITRCRRTSPPTTRPASGPGRSPTSSTSSSRGRPRTAPACARRCRSGPNGAFGRLTDSDANDIANYIQSIPPKTNMIVDMCVWPPVASVGGAVVTAAAAGGGARGGGGRRGWRRARRRGGRHPLVARLAGAGAAACRQRRCRRSIRRRDGRGRRRRCWRSVAAAGGASRRRGHFGRAVAVDAAAEPRRAVGGRRRRPAGALSAPELSAPVGDRPFQRDRVSWRSTRRDRVRAGYKLWSDGATNGAGSGCRRGRRSTPPTWTTGFPDRDQAVEGVLAGRGDAGDPPGRAVRRRSRRLLDGRLRLERRPDRRRLRAGRAAEHRRHDARCAGAEGLREMSPRRRGPRAGVLRHPALGAVDRARSAGVEGGGIAVQPPAAAGYPLGAAATAAALGYLHANCGHCHNQNGTSWRDTQMVLRSVVADTGRRTRRRSIDRS